MTTCALLSSQKFDVSVCMCVPVEIKVGKTCIYRSTKVFHIHRQYCRFAIASTDLIVNPAGPMSLFTIVSAGSDAMMLQNFPL